MAAHGCTLLLACFLAQCPSWAAPGPAGPWATLNIKDGRILHNVRVLSDEGDSVVVRCDEGLVKVPKSSLPQAATDSIAQAPPKPAVALEPDMVMRPFNPDAVALEPEPEAKPKPAPNPAQSQRPAQGPVFKGCTIVSFQQKPFQSALGCEEVVIRNDGEAPVVLFPGNVVCMTAAGARLGGRYFIEDGFPPVTKRREVVGAQGSVDVQVFFTNGLIDVSGVQWSR
jgi:hypothetical protein